MELGSLFLIVILISNAHILVFSNAETIQVSQQKFIDLGDANTIVIHETNPEVNFQLSFNTTDYLPINISGYDRASFGIERSKYIQIQTNLTLSVSFSLYMSFQDRNIDDVSTQLSFLFWNSSQTSWQSLDYKITGNPSTFSQAWISSVLPKSLSSPQIFTYVITSEVTTAVTPFLQTWYGVAAILSTILFIVLIIYLLSKIIQK